MSIMKPYFHYFAIVIFSIFFGSQISEGVLLVPYWQSLNSSDFYIYYKHFGPLINQFYTFVTISAVVMPIIISIPFYLSKSSGFIYSLISTLFAILVLACFYIYFKSTNELFFNAALNEGDLKSELIVWSKWHWTRVFFEFISLLFLVLAIKKNQKVSI